MTLQMTPAADEPARGAGTFSLTLLNHASILLEHDSGIRLLSDPWYSGFAFEEGWGLRFRNDQALEQAQTATHLWISHFHEDHMHVPTLKALQALNPGLVVLANDSFNFKIAAVARRIGFRNIIELRERQPVKLAPDYELVRYPVTGIDNMLLIDAGGYRILNYNDCNLSAYAQKRLARKLGRVDLLLSNFNHAGKLLHTTKVSPQAVRAMLVANFRSNYEHFAPKVIVPFASHHYYRAPESAEQNESMIATDDLLAVDPRIVNLNVGDTLRFDGATGRYTLSDQQPIENPMTVIDRQQHKTVEELTEAGKAYARKLRSGHGVLTRLLPAVCIDVADLGMRMLFQPSQGLRLLEAGSLREPQISCHSTALHSFLTKVYGTDAFAVGAHFQMRASGKARLVSLIAAGMLIENKLDVKSLLGGLFKREGRAFLYNRREEILGILLSGKIFADYHKE